MSKVLCVFEEINICDKLIISLSPVLSQYEIVPISSPVNMTEISSRITRRKCVFFGAGFVNHFEQICGLCDATFILRPEDPQPNLEEVHCTVDNWFNYWVTVHNANKHLDFILQAAYKYMYLCPNSQERKIYRGLIAHGIDDVPTTRMHQYLLSLPNIDEIEYLGKQEIDYDTMYTTQRISRRSKIHIDVCGEKVVACVTFGDGCIRETGFQLIEQTNTSVAIIIDGVYSTKSYKIVCVSLGTTSSRDVLIALSQKSQEYAKAKNCEITGNNFYASMTVPHCVFTEMLM